MSTIQTQINIIHANSGLSGSSAIQRTSKGSGFTSSAIEVLTTDETLLLGDVTTVQQVMLKLISGDDLKVGFSNVDYPMRLSGVGDSILLRLAVEDFREATSVVCQGDTAGSLAGKYFELREYGDSKVWVWLDTGAGAGTAASGSITYGVPVFTTQASGSITYGVPVNGDTVIVNGNTFTKVAAAPGANEFSNIAELETLVEDIINITASENGTVVSILYAHGLAGNACTLALGVGNTGTMAISGATLTGGKDADTVIVNGTTLTCVASVSAANQFSTIVQLEGLIEAISGINSSQNGTVITVESSSVGSAGNAITLALGSGNTGTMAISGATLTGGRNASVAPTVTTERLIQVVIVESSSAATIATAVALALDADASYYCAAPAAATLSIVDAQTGTRTAATAGTTGWATPTETQAGAASPVVHMKSVGSSRLVAVVAPA